MQVTKKGKIFVDGRELPQYDNGRGYLTVRHKRKTYRVHRLVAEAHCKRKRGAHHVEHLNNVKTDNRAKNLEWVTPSENLRRAHAQGLRKFSVKPRAVKGFNDGKMLFFMSINQAAKFVGTSPANIGSVLKGKSKRAAGWAWVYG